jgi:hypothetical protein
MRIPWTQLLWFGTKATKGRRPEARDEKIARSHLPHACLVHVWDSDVGTVRDADAVLYAGVVRRQKQDAAQDALRANVHEDYEVRYWCDKSECMSAQLKAVVAKVGVIAADVEKELKRR